MDLNDSLYESIKYLLGLLLSGTLSYTVWAHKKNVLRTDTMSNAIAELSADQRVVDVEIRTIKEDISEIKDSLKEILRRV